MTASPADAAMPLACAAAPCKSCPYRRDVPSGVWHESEYNKLPGYDGTMAEQAMKGAFGVFMCHQQDGKLCAGWVGAHGAENLLAFRMTRHTIDESVFEHKSQVPLFESGAAACAHGKQAIRRPGERARNTMNQLLRKRARATEGRHD